MKHVLLLCGLLLLAAVLPVRAQAPPDIVVISLDDANRFPYHPVILTPALRGFFDANQRLRNYRSCGPLCAPSRTSLLIGRYPLHVGVRNNDPALPLAETTLAEALRAAGYATACVGKWDHGNANPTSPGPGAHGFDFSLTLRQQDGGQHYPSGVYRNGAWESVPAGTYTTTLLTAEALAWWQAAPGPRFLWLAYNVPHGTVQAPPGGISPYQVYGSTNGAYAAALTYLDARIGELLTAVGPTPVVVILSDHGAYTINGPGKFWGMNVDQGPPLVVQRGGMNDLYEGGIRVPFAARGLGIAPENLLAPALGIDLLPSLLSAAGVDLPAGVDGVNLRSPGSTTGRYACWERPAYPGAYVEQDAVLSPDGVWKAHRLGTAPWVLYHLPTNPQESINVAGTYPAQLNDLVARWDAWRATGP